MTLESAACLLAALLITPLLALPSPGPILVVCAGLLAGAWLAMDD